MRKLLAVATLVAFSATSAKAQLPFSYEAGLFAQYTKYADTTTLKSGVGIGGRVGIFVVPRLALEYEASVVPTSTRTQSGIKSWDNRIDLVLNWPIGDKTKLLIGGGFTGTNYKGDTTHNAYDSGVNALVGIRRCMSDRWSWRVDGVVDFKNPSDQTHPGASTQTYSGRIGVDWLFGGHKKTNPCSADMPAPAPVKPAPAPAPEPARPAPAPPAAAPTPAPAAPAPAPARPAPAPAQPAPRPRELFTFRGVLFEYNESKVTRHDADTLNAAVRYLKAHMDTRVEVQGHTDSKGTDEYNMKLGERRAEAVKAYLVKNGIAADRISTRSFGESQPVADNEIGGKDNPPGRAQNRRVVVIELP